MLYLMISVFSTFIFTGKTITVMCQLVKMEFINNRGNIITITNRLEDNNAFSKIWDERELDKEDYGMDFISDFIIVISMVSAVIILGLMTVNEIKSTQKEIGLNLSLGMSRAEAFFPIVFRQIMCTLSAIFSAYIVSEAVADRLSKVLVQKYRAQGMYIENVFYNLRVEEVVRNMKITLSWKNVLIITGTIILIKLIVICVAYFLVKKISPKELLAR